MAWKKPFNELNSEEVERCFAREEFPDIRNVSCASVVQKCWDEEFESSEDVMLALQAVPGPAIDTVNP
ncbi:hypothetical protein BU26DRAFT_514209 [Trematosphaeria pertusa]|uniref:Serine-threonine/tyrosine-protein kinase catalytic domain-containing protein n=1 Tax=Trematosphaeria pertusa TaxID=390896 RepID=A0A6A6IX96_9PLEO|nr:uncharacterized protein BU26DRAFT_514209 [Trematosphaeria pertusa]KAF2254240.1 hypothetical protein BU26DRAFT_514209 [Trematosphaeria pertusa]